MDAENEKYVGDKLEDVINDNLDELSTMDKGSEEYSRIVKDTKTLLDGWVDIKKVETDFNDHEAQREHEARMKREEVKNQKKSKILEIVIPTAVTALVAGARMFEAKRMFMTTLRCEYADDKAVLNRNFQGLFNSTWRI